MVRDEEVLQAMMVMNKYCNEHIVEGKDCCNGCVYYDGRLCHIGCVGSRPCDWDKLNK